MSTNNIFDKGANFIFRTIYKIQKSENDKKLAKLAHPDQADVQSLSDLCVSCCADETTNEFILYVNTREDVFKSLSIFEKYGMKFRVNLSNTTFGNKLVANIDNNNRKFVCAIHNKYVQKMKESCDAILATQSMMKIYFR